MVAARFHNPEVLWDSDALRTCGQQDNKQNDNQTSNTKPRMDPGPSQITHGCAGNSGLGKSPKCAMLTE